MNIKWSSSNPHTQLNTKNNVTYLTFDIFKEYPLIHGFSTRLGGISKEHLSTMNLSFQRGDKKENVMENYARISHAIGFSKEDLVFSDQQHHTNIRTVTLKDKGKGIIKPRDYEDMDGLVTNVPGIPLVTFYADCVPLLFFDPVKKVIASSHSGWKGTLHRMGEVTVRRMETKFSCNPKDILVAIGPSICQSCYEVDEMVYDAFSKAYDKQETEQIFIKKENQHYQLNLWKANQLVLEKAGIRKEHLQLPDLCTCCNNTLLYSHRASKGKRGNLAAFIMLP